MLALRPAGTPPHPTGTERRPAAEAHTRRRPRAPASEGRSTVAGSEWKSPGLAFEAPRGRPAPRRGSSTYRRISAF